MSSIYKFISCLFIGFSLGGILSTVAKINSAVNIFRLVIAGTFLLVLLLYLILLVIGLKYKTEAIKDKLFSIFAKKYAYYYLIAISFIVGAITFHFINSLVTYG